MAWTPQQDLEGEDESSSDGGVDALRAGRQQAPALPVRGCVPVQPKYSARAHVFSLSLPRDDRLCLALFAEEEERLSPPKSRVLRDVQPSFNSLKKLKRSVSGAFSSGVGTGNGGGGGGGSTGINHHVTRLREDESRGQALDENWLLSRSVPNLLHHQPSSYHGPYSASAGSASTPSAPSPGDQPSFSYLASGGHVMYLPQYETPREPEGLAPRARCYSAGAATRDLRSGCGFLSKSCDDLSASEMRQIRRTPSPDSPRGPRGYDTRPSEPPTASPKRGKGKRFTFQSTVRQIERRRLAERLSKEAELKERQRLSELEAMRQVEEEFQRKRAREKANIRQQLRLFSMDEKLYASLPADWGDAGARADPEGAPSSSPASQSSAHSGGGGACAKTPAGRQPSTSSASGDVKATSTQVLSEFREPRREYREYRPSRYMDSGPESLQHLETKHTTTIHPAAVYDMPKSTQVYVTPHYQRNGVEDNYRREFAHGARPHGRSAASSDSDVSQANGRSASQQAHIHYSHSKLLSSRSISPNVENMSSSSNMEDDSHIADKNEPTRFLPPMNEESHVSLPTIEKPQISNTDGTTLRLTTLQPFVRNGKGYRPIVFNPRTPPAHNIAQTVN